MLDLATVCAGDNLYTTFQKSLQCAQHAESLGFTRYWFSEHHNMPSVASAATAVLIGFVAQGTSTMRIGSGGIMLPNHSPLIIAEQFGTLAELSPGRIDLGLGRAPGTDVPATIAIRGTHPATPYDFKANIQLLQQYLSVDNALAKVRAIPGEGADLPIWILGSSTESAHLAAELGLPYAFASHFAPTQLMQALSIYRSEFKPSAQLDEPYSMACVNMVAAEDSQEAMELATSMYQAFLGIITDSRKPLQPPVSVKAMEEIWSAEQKAYVRQMLSLAMIGDAAQLEENIGFFLENTGIDELMINCSIFDFEKKKAAMTIFAEVMDRLSK